MAADGGIGILGLLAAGAGAILAIYTKEAVQTALQRQIILAQVDAYAKYWMKLVLRHTLIFNVYKSVEDREKKMQDSLKAGESAFGKQLAENSKQSEDLRNNIKNEIAKAVEKNEIKTTSIVAKKSIEIFVSAIASQKQYLMDGKSFITDQNAAILGSLFANNVVTFRSSLLQLLMAMEGAAILAAIDVDEDSRTEQWKVIASLVDSFIIEGEAFFVSLIRLQKIIDAEKRKTFVARTMDVLQGR